MKTVYQYIDTNNRHYKGFLCDEKECHCCLKGPVKDNLIDREQREELLDSLKTLKSDTGFDTNDQLLADIQALEDVKVNAQKFRVGEAYAEILLEEKFQCRFHWNELRDARNPKKGVEK